MLLYSTFQNEKFISRYIIFACYAVMRIGTTIYLGLSSGYISFLLEYVHHLLVLEFFESFIYFCVFTGNIGNSIFISIKRTTPSQLWLIVCCNYSSFPISLGFKILEGFRNWVPSYVLVHK